ncbi:MAG TPA: hypothetical protein PKN44_12165 [Bacteroidales bacterium]|nr:hypothetical protein [Bacteroidales bacterium]
MTERRNSIFAGLAFGLLFGLYLAFRYEIQYALICGPISGLLFGLGMYFFITSKTIRRQTQIVVNDGQGIIRSGSANHFKNREAVGGKLYLLTDRIQFKSHSFNIQNHEMKIGLEEIKEIRFFNSLGIIPNGLELKLMNEQIEKFVVDGRRQWRAEIERQKTRSETDIRTTADKS